MGKAMGKMLGLGETICTVFAATLVGALSGGATAAALHEPGDTPKQAFAAGHLPLGWLLGSLALMEMEIRDHYSQVMFSKFPRHDGLRRATIVARTNGTLSETMGSPTTHEGCSFEEAGTGDLCL